MPLTRDIVATYRGPGRVVRRLLAMGQREDRALAFVMAACVLMFVARWPALARESHLSGGDLNMAMGGTLLAVVFILPLILYLLAGLSHLVARVFGGTGSYYGARLALFWALLAATPLALLSGLVGGFIGPGPAQTVTGLAWSVAFLWFWGAGLTAAERQGAA
ncbi:MAG: YIP1 family protein [Roseivivax sp.]|nr:YIP1 family protein [Roseivivax sp.]